MYTERTLLASDLVDFVYWQKTISALKQKMEFFISKAPLTPWVLSPLAKDVSSSSLFISTRNFTLNMSTGVPCSNLSRITTKLLSLVISTRTMFHGAAATLAIQICSVSSKSSLIVPRSTALIHLQLI